MESNCKSICKKDGESTFTTKLVANVPPKFLENLASIVSEFASWVTVIKVLTTWTGNKESLYARQ